jgi:hypothetical protein
VEENTNQQRSSWRKLELYQQKNWKKLICQRRKLRKLSDETAELESAAGWKAKATEMKNMGDQVDLPFDVYEEEEMQQRRLHKESQPIEKWKR